MTIDEPVEIDAVVADDAMVERLRNALIGLGPEDAVVWDDDEDGEDLSYQLLRALQRDVSADVELGPLPAPVLLPLRAPRRVFGRTATVAAVAAGVLAIGGVAAAATSPGSPLDNVGSAVSSAVHDALDAIDSVAPSRPVGPDKSSSAAVPPSAATPSPAGAQVSAAARSAGAAVQIEERLSLAARMLENGRPIPAGQVLDQAESRLELVSDLALRSAFQVRLDDLRAQALAMAATHGKPSDPAAADADGPGKSASHKPSPKPSQKASGERGNSASARPSPQPSQPAQPGTKPEQPQRPVLPAPAQSAQNR